MMKLILTALTMVSLSAQAGEVDGNAVLGSVIGAAAGTAIGSATAGKDGAVIGGAIGGAVGAAAGSSRGGHNDGAVYGRSAPYYPAPVYIEGGHDRGKHKGHYKHRHRHHD